MNQTNFAIRRTARNAHYRVATQLVRLALPVFVIGTFVVATPTHGQSTDRIRLRNGSSKVGEVTAMNPVEVTLKRGSSGTDRISVEQIDYIIFKNEPNELTQARINADGGYQTALDRLADVDVSQIARDHIRADIEFYLAYCQGRLALQGQGEIGEAGKRVGLFVRDNINNYHYLAATELLGELLLAKQRYEAAAKQFGELSKAPWPTAQARSALLVGRSRQLQGELQQAAKAYAKAEQVAGAAKLEQLEIEAKLGTAVLQVESGELEQGTDAIVELIRDADPENIALHAIAYNALGRSYQQAGKPKEAILAFLHVDTLYASRPEEHAEALYHLAQLWEQIGQAARARRATELLKQRYANSRWAR